MPLVELNAGTRDWEDIAYAALVLSKSSQISDIAVLQNDFRNIWPTSSIAELYTGINQRRKAIILTNHDTVVIGFQGSDEDEIMKNMWTHGKGPNWWDFPYPVHVDGDQVHSFYLDMWNGMKDACLTALSNAVTRMQEEGISPSKVIVAGYSMGGGVSTLAFRDIIAHIINNYGNPSRSPQNWALDHNLRFLVQHLTFASIGAGDIAFLTKLNQLYCQYQIRAWDFLNHWDHTQHVTVPFFRGWRGHRYILPHAVSHQFGEGLGPQGHGIEGYYQCAQWMAEHGTDQVKPAYHYE